MTIGYEKDPEKVQNRLRTSSGMESRDYLIEKTGRQTYTCYSSGGATGTIALSSTALSSRLNSSGFVTEVGTANSKRRALRLARRSARSSDLGTGYR